MTRNQRRALEFGILGVVSAILLVPLASISKTQRCQTNLKRVGLGLMQYVRDYDEHWVRADDWQNNLMPYVKADVFHCPQTKNSYALNRWIVGRTESLFENTPKTPMAFDSVSAQNQPCDGGKSWPTNGVHVVPKDWNRQNSMLWMDGHVSTIPASPKPIFDKR